MGFFLHLNQLTCVLTCAYPIARVFRQGLTSLVTITVVFVNSDAFESLWFWTYNFCHWWILFCGNGVLVFHVSLYRLHAVSIWCLNRFLYYRFSLIFSKASLFFDKAIDCTIQPLCFFVSQSNFWSYHKLSQFHQEQKRSNYFKSFRHRRCCGCQSFFQQIAGTVLEHLLHVTTSRPFCLMALYLAC